MECVRCKSKDVPQSEGGDYLSNRQIPFSVPSGPKEDKVFRVRIIFPFECPLCEGCRKEIVKNGL